ncbi:MAG TPA: zinc metalloprotease, partial [Candidatus Paceibacterota bacterium]|nr:zinc metalloprotease [Verrucomicrobiota bacterium]HRY46454.1 zinc metalloprotease [Candidatus Paceibacterota bacterium]
MSDDKPMRKGRKTAANKDQPSVRICGTQAVHKRLLQTNPEYVARRAASENYALEFARTGRMAARTGITMIPVVVHVVYHTADQNISDAQINSQIDVLNKDFRKANSDISKLPAVFSALAADARVEFKLADKDPANNPTNGITRTATAKLSFTHDDKVKKSATGGHDAWSTDKFLNIWVCPLSGGLLGYAQFPGGPADTDGVVINYTAFGTSGTASAPFNLGRSATHEIGHYLNLYHIWGDDGTGCTGTDFVGDTPNQGGPNYGKPSFPHITCGNAPNGDLFMNYMDYVDDDTMFMFTAGQVTRIQACLDSDRKSLGYQKPSIGTIKFLEDQPTVKFADEIPTLKFKEDQPSLKFKEDQPSLKFKEDQPS